MLPHGGEGTVLYFRGTRCHRNGWHCCCRGARGFWAVTSGFFLHFTVKERASGIVLVLGIVPKSLLSATLLQCLAILGLYSQSHVGQLAG